MRHRILVIDDLPDNLKVFRAVLERHLPDTDIITALGGEEGLKTVNEKPPDLVLLDAKMPGIDGFEVCRKIKSDSTTEHIPVLMVSAVMVGARDRVAGLESGADGYICKPFQTEELIAQVRALLRVKEDEDQLRQHEELLEKELRRRTGALAESERRFRSLFENSPEPILLLDEQKRILEANPAAARLWGLELSKIIGRSFPELFPLPDEISDFSQAISDDVPRMIEASLTHRDETLHLECFISRILLQNRRVYLAHVHDVTMRRQMENALSEVARGVSAATGFAFFYALVESLARALGVEHVILCELAPGSKTEALTLAVYADGEIQDNFRCRLKGSPCEAVVAGKKLICHPNDVTGAYPTAARIRGRKASGYIGAPLLDSRGNCLGVLAVMSRNQLKNAEMARNLVQIFAVRAAAELERKHAIEELWTSEEKYRSLADDVLNASPVATAIFDADSSAVWVNEAFEDFFGIPRRQIIGRQREVILDRIKDVLDDPGVLRREVFASEGGDSKRAHSVCHVVPANGRSERWLEYWVQPIQSGLYMGGHIEQFADITDQKRAQHILQQYETRLRRQNRVLVELTGSDALYSGNLHQALRIITEAAADTLEVERVGIWFFNEDRSELHCEDIFLRSSRSHTRGDTVKVADYPAYFHELELARAIPAHDARNDPRTREFTRTYLEPLNIVSMLNAPIRMNGQTIGVICHEQVGSPRAWEPEEQNFAGTMADLAALAREAAERLQAEKERERLARAVAQAAEAVMITDVHGTLQYINPAFEHITGYSRHEAIGRNLRILKSNRHGSEFYRSMWSRLSAGKVWSGRIVNRRKNGTLYEVDEVISPIRDVDGNIVNYVAVMRDVTREVELEQQFRQSQKLESVGRLAGGIAHDFNNLLTSILGFSRMILDRIERSDPIYDDVREIVRAGERAAKLTHQLLALGRKQVMRMSTVNVNAVVMEMDQLLRRTLGEDIELVTVLGEDAGDTEADPGLLEQVIINLAVNARDAMPKGGKLTIETERVVLDADFCRARVGIEPGEYLKICVRDIGTGMPPDVLEHVFEPFFTTKEQGKGTGLGLATVYGIVKQFHGYIEIHSEVNVGTEVVIYLPPAKRPARPAEHPAVRPLPRGTETILVVEDEDTVRHLSVRMLRSLGYHVLESRHGGEALLICERYDKPIDLVLTDVVMPHIGGRELVERLRKIRSDFKVLYMSGFTDERLGADTGTHVAPLLPKPFTREGMAFKVRSVLDSGRPTDRRPKKKTQGKHKPSADSQSPGE